MEKCWGSPRGPLGTDIFDIKIFGPPGDPTYRHSKKLIARSLFFGCLMSQVKGWDGFWLDDFSVSGTFFWGEPPFCS